jgi:hypothetical protein
MDKSKFVSFDDRFFRLSKPGEIDVPDGYPWWFTDKVFDGDKVPYGILVVIGNHRQRLVTMPISLDGHSWIMEPHEFLSCKPTPVSIDAASVIGMSDDELSCLHRVIRLIDHDLAVRSLSVALKGSVEQVAMATNRLVTSISSLDSLYLTAEK